jgi:hypothetical protein
MRTTRAAGDAVHHTRTSIHYYGTCFSQAPARRIIPRWPPREQPSEQRHDCYITVKDSQRPVNKQSTKSTLQQPPPPPHHHHHTTITSRTNPSKHEAPPRTPLLIVRMGLCKHHIFLPILPRSRPSQFHSLTSTHSIVTRTVAPAYVSSTTAVCSLSLA